LGRSLRFSVFKRLLGRWGVAIKQGSKPTHYNLSKVIRGERRVYTIAVHDNEVLDCYVHKTRRIFELLPDNGVSDEDFLRK